MILIKLIVESYEAAKNKGWWDEETDQRQVLMLVISEISEAVEALRVQRFADMGKYLSELPTKTFADAFKEGIKDSFEDEIADTFIRLCSFSGRYCTRFDNIEKYYEDELTTLKNIKIENPSAYLFSVVRAIQDIHFSSFKTQNIGESLGKLSHLARSMNFDLFKHIDLKIKYNSIREDNNGKLF